MATQPHHRIPLTTANAPPTPNALLSTTLPSTTTTATTLPPHLSHCPNGRLGSTSSGVGVCGGGGGSDDCGHGRGICSSSRSHVPNSSSTSTNTSIHHYQAPRPASRRFRPCSLCGTKALRPQPTYLPNSPVGPLEQPIVLLHRLEDGLPLGDVKSLLAYGTIRLLPVQSPHNTSDCEEGSDGSDSSTGDRTGHTMEDACKMINGSENDKEEIIVPWCGSDGFRDARESQRDMGRLNIARDKMKNLLCDTHSSKEANFKKFCKDDNASREVLKLGNVNSILKNTRDCEDDDNSNGSVHVKRLLSVKDEYDKNSKREKSLVQVVNKRCQSAKTKRQKNICRVDKNDCAIDFQFSADKATSYPSVLTNSLHCTVSDTCSSQSVSQELSSSFPPTSDSSPCKQSFGTPQYLCQDSATEDISHDRLTKQISPQSPPCVVDHNSFSSVNSPVTSASSVAAFHSSVPSPPVSVPFPVYIPGSPNKKFSPSSFSTLCSPPSPPSPASSCGSAYVPFSPPTSPPSDVEFKRAVEDLQAQPLSPYSPGTFPGSPASFTSLSHTNSPPSPTVSEESLQSSPEQCKYTVEHDGFSIGSLDSIIPSSDSQSSDTVSAPQRIGVPLHDSKIDSGKRSQVDYFHSTNNEFTHPQIDFREKKECYGPLEVCNNMAYDDSEQKNKPNLDTCASSIGDEHAKTENAPMKIKFRIKPKISKLALQRHNKDDYIKTEIPKIVLTLKGDGPNKEYSCSNRIRSEDQNIFSVTTPSRKHKYKRDRKEKIKYKTKKSIKAGKHKRHLELFGEDSNDSMDTKKDSGNGEEKDNIQEADEDSMKTPLAFPTLGESPVYSDDNIASHVQKVELYNFSENVNRVCEKIKYCKPDNSELLDGSFSDSLPDLEPTSVTEDTEKTQSHQTQFEQVREERNCLVKSCKETRNEKRIKFQRRKPTRGMLAKRKILKILNQRKAPPIKKWKKRGLYRLRKDHSGQNGKVKLARFSFGEKHHSLNGHVVFSVKRDLHTKKNVPNLEHKLENEYEQKDADHTEQFLSSSSEESSCMMKSDDRDTLPSSPDTTHIIKKEITLDTDKQTSKKITSSSVRTRRERNCKILDSEVHESMRDPDKCLWVSFGVDAPVRIPASDIPSFQERVVKSRTTSPNAKTNTLDDRKASAHGLSENELNRIIKLDKDRMDGSNDFGNVRINTVDYLVEETAKMIVKEYNERKETFPSKIVFPSSNVIRNCKPVKHPEGTNHNSLSRETLKNTTKQRQNLAYNSAHSHQEYSDPDAADRDNKTNPVFSSNSNSENSDRLADEKEMLEVYSGNETRELDRKKSYEDLVGCEHYYRPKKIQKVLPESDRKTIKSSSNDDSAQNRESSPELQCSKGDTYLVGNDGLMNSVDDPVVEATGESNKPLVNEPSRRLSSHSRSESEDSNLENYGKGKEVVKDGHASPPCDSMNGSSQALQYDPAFDKGWGSQKLSAHIKGSLEVNKQKKSPSHKLQECASQDVPESSVIKENPLRKIKESKRRSRKIKRKEENSSDSESSSHSEGSGKSAYKEIQQRIEVQHEEERGRRLAQEIKGFNWLEQKIKNSSLNPPTTTTTISSLPNRTPALVPRKNFLSRTLSSPASGFGSSSWPLLTSSAVCKKNEPDFRRNSFTGTSGLKGHLQTAVPPLLPSSRVTALPKRRASPPFLSQPSSTGESVTVTGTTLNSSPSTVRGNIDTTMGVLCGPVQSSGLATYTIAGVSPESLYSSSECDKVTLYSSTDSNKATVYGIPDPQLEVLYEDTEVRTTSSHGDTQDSRKNCENIIPVTVQHLSESPSSEMSSQPFNSSAAEKQDDWNNLQKGEDHNPPVRTPSSDPPASARTEEPANIRSILEDDGAACGPSIGVRFSHKQALLKRAFSNMLKSSESSPDCSEENNNPFPPTNTVDKKSQDTNEHALVIDDRATDASPFKVPVSSVDENSQCLTESTEAKTHDQNEALDTASQSNTKLTSETKIVKSEISDSNAESLHVKTEISKESENNISVDSLEKFEEKILKCLPAGTEEKVSGQGKEREVGGMNPTHIFSMLYEELKKTRQEVERLRKRQEELMHTEKNDRRDDEQKETEEKVVIQMETPQSPQVIDIKSEEEEAATEKTARISIRNDLLATVKDTPLQRQVISPNRVQSVINTKGAISANAGAVAEQPIISPLPKTSPSVPHLGPASCRASPGSSQASPLTRTSPLVSPQLSSQGLSQAELSVVNTSLGPPMSSPTVTQRCASSSPYSTPSVINHGLPRSSPVIMSSPLFSRCSPRSSVSPGIPRSSPGVLSNSTTAKSSEVPKDKNLVEMMPSRLRSAFGINMDVEVMAVTGGNRPPLTEPQPQTYLQVIGDQQYRQESPLLLDAVRAQAFESIKNSDKDRNLLHNMVPYKLPIPHESTKRFHLSQPVENEVKRSRMSTSDLPEFPSTSQKPPPLKPVVTVHRRYSEGSESHKMEATVVPVPHPNVQGVPASTSEHNIVATSCPYTIPSSSPSQHPANRNIDNTLDRKMKYQALSAQYAHFQQHLGSSPPVMRSLGPDKATIIPIPTPHPNPQNIHPFGKPFSAPASRAPSLDHHHPTRIEHSLSPEEYSNSLYFQKMKQTVQHNYEASLSTTKERGPVTVGQERLPIPSKTMQPQTFAPRVLVRESVPENPLHMLPPPPPSFTNSLFPPDCNPHVSNVGRGHYLNNTLHHSSQHPNVQHMVTSGLLMSGLKGSSATPATAKSNPRSIAGGPSGNGEKKRCLNCPQQARFLCSGCKKAWYCSETCQRGHWAIHNTSCVP